VLDDSAVKILTFLAAAVSIHAGAMEKLAAMGFPRPDALFQILKSRGDVEVAVGRLLKAMAKKV
jgi:hypothetical protein